MRFVHRLLLASSFALAGVGAHAQVTGSLISASSGSFLSLSAPGACTALTPCTLSGAASATIVGGTVYNSTQPFADIPAGAIFGGNFLSAGPTSTEPSTVTFGAGGVSYLSFLWGSPDLYNQLTVLTTAGSESFTVSSLGFPVTNGNQSFSQYVQFVPNAGVKITGLVLNNSPAIDAFEVANFSVNAVPEPETYALLLAGLGAVGFIAKRRKLG